VFVHDRLTGVTERVSDEPADTSFRFAGDASIVADGRFVAFFGGEARPCQVLFFSSPCRVVFVHDRLTGVTERASVASDGTEGNGPSGGVISADGRFVAFESSASNLVSGDMNETSHVFVRGLDPTDRSADLAGDGDLNDKVLRVLDTGAATVAPVTLGPANATAVFDGKAAFLRPEAAGAPGQPSGVDLNGDGDTTDDVVHLWTGAGEPQNLGRAATAVALSDRWLATLVSEPGQGNTDFNGDGDTGDTVVQVYPVTAPSGTAWTNVGQAADTVDVAGSVVAFITLEAAQGHQDLNGDGDTTDRVLQVYDADA